MNPSSALILNVDDNDGARYAKTRILQRAGFNVAEAANGTDALAFVYAQLPDLVLLDVKLPDINGIEVCRQIKAQPKSSMVLVLQTSAALTGSIDKIRGLEGGADNYLAAPIEADELIANVNALLRLRIAQTALYESEERFRQLAENINDVFWTFSFPDLTLLYLSNAYETLWHREPAVLQNKPDDWLDGIHADDRERVQLSFNALLEGRVYDEEYRVVQPDGAVCWMRDRCFPIKNDAKGVYRIVRVTSDISEAKNAEKLLRQADIHKDEFLATLAHELRNPLGPIRNAVALMQQVEPVTTELQMKARAIIARQVDHLARLVDDLLDVARISKGKIALRLEPIEIRTFIGAAIETVRPFIDSRNHLLEVVLPEEQVWVMGDAVRLAQGINNLLHNAAKYTPRGGTISLIAETDQMHLTVSVRDNGIGIAPERITEIFALFAQGETSPDRAQDGLGIGLSLVTRLVELHQGTILVHSEGKGKGSTFTIKLPVYKKQNEQLLAPEKQVKVIGQKDLPKGLKVLIVDDNIDAIDTIAMLLTHLGHQITSAHDALSAMALAKQHFPDVMLLDIGLPGLDGFQLAKMIRQQPEFSKIKLIALTGYGTERDREAALAAGFDHHLVKPANLEQLAALIVAPVARQLGNGIDRNMVLDL
jgi:PAS domain S-box-containing protein